MSFALQKSSPYKKFFQIAFTQIKQEGILDRAIHEVDQRASAGKKCFQNKHASDETFNLLAACNRDINGRVVAPLSLKKVFTIFLMLLFGLVIAITVMILETFQMRAGRTSNDMKKVQSFHKDIDEITFKYALGLLKDTLHTSKLPKDSYFRHLKAIEDLFEN